MSATPTPDTTPTTDPIKDGLLNRILKLTKPEDSHDPAPEPVPEPAPEPAKDPEPAPEPSKDTPEPSKTTPDPEPPKAGPKPVRFEKKEKPLTRKDLEALIKKDPEPAPAPEPAKDPEPPAPNLDGLIEEEIKEVEIAAYAEKKDPKLAGLGSKLADFYRARNAELERRREEDPDFDPTSDPDFRAWIRKNQPNFSRTQRDTFRELKIKEEVLAEADAKYQRELAQMRKELTEVKVKPAVEQRVSALEREALEALDGDLGSAVKEAGGDLKKLAESHPLEAEVIGKTLRGAQRIAREFLLIRNGAKDLNTEDPVHAYIETFVSSMADQLASAPAEQSVRDGKRFVAPDKFNPKTMSNTHWTFEDEDVVAMLRAEALREASEEIARREAEIARLGFTRKPKAAPDGAPPPAPEPPKADPVPKATSRPSGGPVPSDTPPSENVLLKILKLNPPA